MQGLRQLQQTTGVAALVLTKDQGYAVTELDDLHPLELVSVFMYQQGFVFYQFALQRTG